MHLVSYMLCVEDFFLFVCIKIPGIFVVNVITLKYLTPLSQLLKIYFLVRRALDLCYPNTESHVEGTQR